MKTYIINPDTNQGVTLEAWAKEAEPKRAQLVALQLDGGGFLIISKKPSETTMNAPDAQKYAENTIIMGAPGRCPKRKEAIDIYDARFLARLDEAIDLIGGRTISYRYWTCEKDADPDYASVFWCASGGYGCANSNYLYTSYLALPLLLLDNLSLAEA